MNNETKRGIGSFFLIVAIAIGVKGSLCYFAVTSGRFFQWVNKVMYSWDL